MLNLIYLIKNSFSQTQQEINVKQIELNNQSIELNYQSIESNYQSIESNRKSIESNRKSITELNDRRGVLETKIQKLIENGKNY
jgi:hypothetical protein